MEFANIAIESQVSGFLLVGYSSSEISGDKSQASKGGVDYWILKIDNNGSKVWDKTFGGSSADYGKGILPTADGGYIVLGQSDSGMSGDKSQASYGSRDIWMIKIDENGSKNWDKSLGGSGFDYFANAVTTSDGNFVLVGDSLSGQNGDKSEASYSGSRDCWLIKIDQNGSKIWDRTIGSSGSEFARDITNSSDGGFIIATYSDGSADGNKSEPSIGLQDYWVFKTDANGTMQWDLTLGGSGIDKAQGITSIAGGVVVAGASASSADSNKSDASRGGDDYWLIKLSEDGVLLWEKSFGGNNADKANNIISINEDYFLVVGDSSSSIGNEKTEASYGSTDVWALKLFKNGEISPFSASDDDNDTLTWTISGASSFGDADASGTGSFPTNLSYKPNQNFNGNDSFVLQVSDGNVTVVIKMFK